MVEAADAVPNDFDNLRMAMAEDRAHLPRGEIEDGTSRLVVDESTLGTVDHRRSECTAVPDEVSFDVVPKPGILLHDTALPRCWPRVHQARSEPALSTRDALASKT